MEPFLWRWHQNIFEFMPSNASTFLKSFAVLGVFVVASLALLLRSSVQRERRSLAVLVIAAALVPLAASLAQRRWQNMLSADLVLVPLVVAMLLPVSDAVRPAWKRWRAILLLLPLLGQFGLLNVLMLQRAKRLLASGEMGITLSSFAAVREAAEYLRREEGQRPLVLLSSSWPSTVMAYVGDYRTIGSLYWENMAGLEAVLDILLAQSDDEALRLIRERGVTHLIFLRSGYNPASDYIKKYGFEDEQAIKNSFEARLFTGHHPPWLEWMNFRSAQPQFRSNPRFYTVVILRVDPAVLAAS